MEHAPGAALAVLVAASIWCLCFVAYRCWAKRDRARCRSLREGGP